MESYGILVNIWELFSWVSSAMRIETIATYINVVGGEFLR